MLCTTATANDRVVADVAAQLRTDAGSLLTIRGTLDRPALRLEVVDLPEPGRAHGVARDHIPRLPGSGIVYCSHQDVDVVAEWLRTPGHRGRALQRRLRHRSRVRRRKRPAGQRGQGRGRDLRARHGLRQARPGFVVHYQAPGSPIAYYQQVGRAGRKLADAPAVLLRGVEDREIQDYFIQDAFPPEQRVREVLDALEASEAPVSMPAIERR